jgi:CNT family concentrative nucleoside transporter
MGLKFISLLGWFTMVAVAWAISYNRKLFPWRTVVWGVGLQFVLALLILKTPWGGALFDFAGKVIQKLILFSNEGCKFVFGPLADESLLAEKFGAGNSVIFAILVTGTIIIVACISSLLYHWGILQRVVRAIAWVMRKVMRDKLRLRQSGFQESVFIRVHPWLNLFLPPDGSGTTTTMATGLFNHKIRIYFDFVM